MNRLVKVMRWKYRTHFSCGFLGVTALAIELYSFSPSSYLAFEPIIEPAQHTPVQRSVDSQTLTHILGYSFADRDLAIYKEIYAAQNNEDWAKANQLISQLRDTTLLGDVLKDRYLSESYETQPRELVAWLNHYPDMPGASRVMILAKRKADDSTVPDLTISGKKLSGVGIRDGLHGAAMPPSWHNGLKAWEKADYNQAWLIFSKIAGDETLSPWHSSAANFWAYRAADKLGQDARAQQHLQKAANAPFTLYGTLARYALGADPLKAQLPKIKPMLLAHPAIKRAAAFVALEEPEKADNELRYLYSQVGEAEKQQLITVVSALDLPALQIRMSQMLYRDQYSSHAAAYPMPRWVPHYDMIIDPALVYAISRQESAFDPTAESPAGARGIMQLMPNTARYMVKRYQLDEIKLASLDFSSPLGSVTRLEDLYAPDVNLTIGQYYLHYLAQKDFISGDVIRLLAAYNAGPAKLIEWNKRFADINDPLLFIESIPYKETRHYVKQVLANYMIYNELMSNKEMQASALLGGEWPQLHRSPASIAHIAALELRARTTH